MEMADWQEKSRVFVRRVCSRAGSFLVYHRSSRSLALIFVVAFLVGALIKSLTNDFLTIGFDDYRLSRSERIVDLNTLQKELLRNGGSLAMSEKSPVKGESCSEEDR